MTFKPYYYNYLLSMHLTIAKASHIPNMSSRFTVAKISYSIHPLSAD